MPHAHFPAGVHIVHGRPRTGRKAGGKRRAWRLRSRRAQVSAVATILGLLLIVTFIANYLTTSLPNTMAQNDEQHGVQVQDQVAQLSAILASVAQTQEVGAQVSQPITLGSQNAPPFAGQDGSSVLPLSNINNKSGNYPQTTATFTLQGPMVYAPPTGFGLSNAAQLPSGCTVSSGLTMTCVAINRANPIKWNFSAGDNKAYSVTLGTGGNLVNLNFATNGSTISISGISGMPTYIQVLGSNDTLSISNNGGGNNPISINITGSYDTVAAGSFPGGASTIVVHVIGNFDYINGDPASGGNTVIVSVIGVYDTLAVVPGSGSNYYTFFTGFDAFRPLSGSCPYGALAHNDSVTGYNNAKGQSANAHLYQTFNNSTSNPGTSTHNPGSRWTITNQTVAPFACPFVTNVQIPVLPTGTAGFIVQMHNTYAPSAEVAYDQGTVVYVQPGALPIFVVPPSITIANGALSMFVPLFANTVSGESGVGTAEVNLRLLTTTSLSLPSNGYTFVNGSKINITVTSQYAAAWYSYFQSVPAFSPYLVSCTGSNSVCTALYKPGGPLGTVKLSIPTTGLALNLLVAVYAVSIS